MANRRMFSKDVCEKDDFLDMPLSAQALYMHISLHGDDDGFVGNPRSIQRMCGASADDLKLLIAKNYLIGFESGVVCITDWRVSNTLQNDRYHETLYLEEKSMLSMDENKRYFKAIEDGLFPGTTADKPKIEKPKKHKYGKDFNKVLLTDEEYEKLRDKFGSKADEYIDRLDRYIASKGDKYESHYATILNWHRNDYGDVSETAEDDIMLKGMSFVPDWE